MIHSRPLSFSFVFSTVNSKCMLSVAIGDGWIQTRGPLGSTATTLPQPRLSKSPKTLVKYFIIDRSKISTFSERNKKAFLFLNQSVIGKCKNWCDYVFKVTPTIGLYHVAQQHQVSMMLCKTNNKKSLWRFTIIGPIINNFFFCSNLRSLSIRTSITQKY